MTAVKVLTIAFLVLVVALIAAGAIWFDLHIPAGLRH
jgi:hypothetical protein